MEIANEKKKVDVCLVAIISALMLEEREPNEEKMSCVLTATVCTTDNNLNRTPARPVHYCNVFFYFHAHEILPYVFFLVHNLHIQSVHP